MAMQRISNEPDEKRGTDCPYRTIVLKTLLHPGSRPYLWYKRPSHRRPRYYRQAPDHRGPVYVQVPYNELHGH
jgi:hypothetical protein